MKTARTREIKGYLRKTTENSHHDIRITFPAPYLKIDWIISRLPNKVNYFKLNGKKTKAITRIEQELRMKYEKCKIVCNFVNIENKAKNTSKTKKMNWPGNKNKKIKNKVEYDGEEDDKTREEKSKKWKNLSQILIPPMKVYITVVQMPAETTIGIRITTMITTMERRERPTWKPTR